MDKADDTRPVQCDEFSSAHDSKTTSKKSFVRGYLVHTEGSDIEGISNEGAGKDIGGGVCHLRIEFSDRDLGHRAAYTAARIANSREKPTSCVYQSRMALSAARIVSECITSC